MHFPGKNISRLMNDAYNIKVSYVYINGGYTYWLRRYPIGFEFTLTLPGIKIRISHIS
jgi:hypothetical protein